MSAENATRPEPLDAFPCEDCAHPSRYHRRDEGATGRDDPYPCRHAFCSCPHFARPPGYMDAMKLAVEYALLGRPLSD